METLHIGLIAGGGGLCFIIVISIIICCCCCRRQAKAKVLDNKQPSVRGASPGPSSKDDSTCKTAVVFDLQSSQRGGASNRIPGIPKLPPKGDEVDAPLPGGYRARGDPGMTAPIMNIGGGSSGGRGRGDPGMTAPIMNIGGGAPGKKRGPRPKRVPQPGHTAPVQPADEDPTMPVEDDMMAYKMAAKNRPSTPPPPFPRR